MVWRVKRSSSINVRTSTGQQLLEPRRNEHVVNVPVTEDDRRRTQKRNCGVSRNVLLRVLASSLKTCDRFFGTRSTWNLRGGHRAMYPLIFRPSWVFLMHFWFSRCFRREKIWIFYQSEIPLPISLNCSSRLYLMLLSIKSDQLELALRAIKQVHVILPQCSLNVWTSSR